MSLKNSNDHVVVRFCVPFKFFHLVYILIHVKTYELCFSISYLVTRKLVDIQVDFFNSSMILYRFHTIGYTDGSVHHCF